MSHRRHDVLWRERPIAVGMREIRLPAQHVFVEPIHVLHTDFVADEAGVEVPFENVDGTAVAVGELRVRPATSSETSKTSRRGCTTPSCCRKPPRTAGTSARCGCSAY